MAPNTLTKRDVDAILFDLGGVVFEIDFERAFSVWTGHSGEPQDAIASRFSFDTSYEHHERGEIDAYQYFASLRSTLSIDLTDAELAEGWNSIYGDECGRIGRCGCRGHSDSTRVIVTGSSGIGMRTYD